MPAISSAGQPGDPSDWFSTPAGRVLIDSEEALVAGALAERPGQPWLRLAPPEAAVPGLERGLQLSRAGAGWHGTMRCAMPFPLPSDCFATVIVQHVARDGADDTMALLDEVARILVPGGRLWLFALNPLAPYRWHWKGSGLSASEPLFWRRRLRAKGLQPEAISLGVGPAWKPSPSPQPQSGPGLRAAYLLRAERRVLPLTPLRPRRALRLAPGLAPT